MMRVSFYKFVEHRVTSWEAVRGKRTKIRGATMALGRGEPPHDLVQLIVEAAVGIEHGFWGCVADGATFRSQHVKVTKAGRRVIAEHRAELTAAEHAVGEHVARWKAAEPTPAAEPLERIGRIWAALGDDESVTLEWPSLELVSDDLSGRRPRARTHRPSR